MVYRRETHERERPPSDGPLLVVDASGRRGRPGRDGARGADGTGPGEDGGRGGDAAPAEPGQDAGTVMVRLEPSGDDAVFVTGQRITPEGERQGVREERRFGARGALVFAAVGGHGGDGGRGGRGGDGQKGHRGRNASRYASASNGGPGGNGGHGGHGSEGAAGGRGGYVVVEVDDDASHLLMLVEHAVEGGGGGAAGTNGPGGLGGPGGDGGRSYHWTTTERYTDSNGVQRSRTISHHNPGGSDGPTGRAGAPGRARLHPGAAGDPGQLSIHLKHQDQIAQYPGRYDLELVSFTHRSENRDGIYEPGERVMVENVTVKNRGGMPTPGHCDVTLRLRRSGWVLPEDEALVVPRRLAPGETHVFEDRSLTFRIGDHLPEGPDAPLARPDTVRHRADVPLVSRTFPNYEGTVSDDQGIFVIRYPIEGGELQSLRSLPPGQAARMSFRIGNVSGQAYGRDSACARRLGFRLQRWQSDLGDEHAGLWGPDDRLLSLEEGHDVEIDHLAAGETRDFEVTLGMKKDAPVYKSVQLLLTLGLGQIDEPERLRPVQYRSFQTRVAQRYRYHPDADLLLVVHHRTTREELLSWRALADELGFTFGVWDLSLERGLPLHQQIDGHTLSEAFANKTIVILDDVIETPIGAAAAHHLIDAGEVFTAMQEGVSFAFVGEKLNLHEWLVSTAGEPEARDDAMALVPQRSEVPSSAREAEVSTWRFFGRSPEASWLRKKARWLSRLLTSRFPRLRFCIVETYEPEVVDTFLWMKKYRVGRLRIIPTLPAAAGCLVNTDVDTETRQDPAYIGGLKNLRTLMLARSFDEKLARLDSLLAGRPDHQLVPRIVEGLLADLANEQAALLQRRGRIPSEVLRAGTPYLDRLAGYRWEARGAPDDPAGQAIIEMVAALRFGGRARWRWWEWTVYPFRRAPALSRRTYAQTERVLARFFRYGSETPDETVRRAVTREVARHDRTLKDAYVRYGREYGTDESAHLLEAFATDHLRRAMREDGITTDTEVLDHDAERVFSEADFRDIEATHRRDREARGKLRRAGDAAENAMLRSWPEDSRRDGLA